jgi:peptidoglycan/LPS O-acetylase OafA/YrhL
LLKTGEAFGVKSGADFSRNNLDCLRLILASIVALFHLHVLSGIHTFDSFGRYLSPTFAVRSFFVISGLLIYRSYTRSRSVRSYFEKRIRRIYPAYFTIIVVAAFGLFPLSVLPASKYFGLGLLKYLGANLVFMNFLVPSLPGVFANVPNSAVNGALWTLKIEVLFYLFVPVMHWLSERFGTKVVLGTLFVLSCIWKYTFEVLATKSTLPAVLTFDRSRNIYSQLAVQFPGQLAYFIAGIVLLLYFDKLKNYFGVILAGTVALYLVDHFFTGGLLDSGGTLDLLWISGIVFMVGFWRYFGNFSKHGDFSYGVYIVHWPILQTMVALHLRSLNPFAFLALAVTLIFLGAFMMWHLVEKRFLASSSHYRQGDESPAAGPTLPG